MRRRFAFRTLATGWVISGFLTGLICASLWFASSRAWDRHLTGAFAAGFSIFESLRTSGVAPDGVHITTLSGADRGNAQAGKFERISGTPKPAYVTNMSLHLNVNNPIEGAVLSIVVISDKLRYQVSELSAQTRPSVPEKFGQLTRLLATYCSQSIIYTRFDGGEWQRTDGTDLWGCDVAPKDYRLIAALGAAVFLAALITHVANISATFQTFAQALLARRRLGGPASYTTQGPAELREIVDAVNMYLEAERESLSKRATVLSGVSHDLGTPAARLRLRTALIEDQALRAKFEGDIDKMTGMIESVLTFTRAELNVEEPRKLSLISLIDALVDDYSDTGSPVSFQRADPVVVKGSASLFMSRQGQGIVPEDRHVLVTARPIALQRAITNLIDNALKYGRRATLRLETSSDTATILVEDEGTDLTVEAIHQLLAPFQRGENTQSVDGTGLGLTIVATIATMHGGNLSFEKGPVGLRARLTIQR
ncbi:hypothetical protein NBRC116601_13240 [Cognatishimia sp. WU-CL00825]|uniref:sensor histidine kinase n=1 Tax=Cognatishimia sp. WU-CL00825 TaxID=3127658 RepID=UPI003103C127